MHHMHYTSGILPIKGKSGIKVRNHSCVIDEGMCKQLNVIACMMFFCCS